MNESAAIKLCLRHQDPRGFEYLVEKYRREAYFHAVSLLGNGEDAADACQESFARAFAAIRRQEHLSQFYPWFYRILRNCCLNVIARRRTAANYDSQAGAADSALPGPATRVDNPYQMLERAEEHKQVWETLAQLKAEFREILMLKYIDGCSYAELAQRLAIPRGTVMSRLYHARKNFARLYEAMETGKN
jgi:RNA polymerase sigma-70 factor, ECF subfamily